MKLKYKILRNEVWRRVEQTVYKNIYDNDVEELRRSVRNEVMFHLLFLRGPSWAKHFLKGVDHEA